MSTYTFITNAFRYAEAYDNVVRGNYTLARAVELQGRLTNLTDAQTVVNTLHGILKAPRQRFEVTVRSVSVISLSDLDGQTPCALLTSNRFELSAGRLVLIPDFTIDLGAGQTVLRCWG